MTWWRHILDRERMRTVALTETGISTCWATIGDLDEPQRNRCVELAAEIIERIDQKIDKPCPHITLSGVSRTSSMARRSAGNTVPT
jgi:hypothetical protein